MRRFFQTIGMISLICVSFIFTEKTANVVKEMDSIMIEIKEKSSQYKVDPLNATINANTIIPGMNGIIVDEKSSYKEMKRIGSFNEQSLKFKQLIPEISIKKNYNKYVISGNKNQKKVSLIFMIDNETNISNVEKVLTNSNIKANFFITSIWLENNNNKLTKLIDLGHNIGNLSYNRDYSHSDFIWMDTIIKKVGKQNLGFCYSEVETDLILKNCSLNKNYTIMPNLVVDKNPTKTIKDNIKNGSIISLPITKEVETELLTIINYIKSKGYNIVNLEELLSEANNN